ncbi:hypothetical protein IFR05_001655 [Cadophora sp. M221]|nr:hypothetical protein IFR05_001655 [Cadophora sp. M221]
MTQGPMVNSLGTANPPGTVLLHDLVQEETVLQPQPSGDPNDPLAWSNNRKAVNFALVLYFSLMTFVLVDIGPIAWGPVNQELGISFGDLNNSFAANLAGLGTGCILTIPLTYRFGRRPVYLFCLLLQLAGSIWQAKTQTAGDIIGSNVICGLAGAASESIVQLTIYDLFFVHQRGLMNAIYLFIVSIGAFLSLVPAGYIVESQGWRWSWWWTTILIGAGCVLFFFFFEESKFVPCSVGVTPPATEPAPRSEIHDDKNKADVEGPTTRIASRSFTEGIPKKSLAQRFALVTPSDIPVLPLVLLPFRLFFLLPAVVFVSLMYGALISWYSIIATTQSTYLLYPPYEFGASSIGLFNIAAFVGAMIGSFLGALSDRFILYKARRNGGVYEPEDRLWLALPSIVILPGGILLYGLVCIGSFQRSVPLFSALDSVIGFAFVAVAFIRNSLAMIFVFALTPWLEQMGLRSVMIITACLSFAIAALSIPMIIWGKAARVKTAEHYRKIAGGVPGHRLTESR